MGFQKWGEMKKIMNSGMRETGFYYSFYYYYFFYFKRKGKEEKLN